MGVFILRIIRALGWRVIRRVVEIIRARGFERRHRRWFLVAKTVSRETRARVRLSRLLCWSSLFVDGCVLCEKKCVKPQTVTDSSFFPRPKTSQKNTLSRLSRRRRRRRRRRTAAHSRVTTAANLFYCAESFFFILPLLRFAFWI